MNIKAKILVIFLFSRITDLITTYYSYNGSLEFETSPLIRLLHLNWNGLILLNIVIVFLIYMLLFKFFSDKRVLSNEISFKEKIHSFSDYLSYIFFKKKVSFKDFLISKDFDYRIFINSFILTLPLTISIISLVASINNILVIKKEGLLPFLNKNQILIVIILFTMIFQFLMLFFYNLIRYKILKS